MCFLPLSVAVSSSFKPSLSIESERSLQEPVGYSDRLHGECCRVLPSHFTITKLKAIMCVIGPYELQCTRVCHFTVDLLLSYCSLLSSFLVSVYEALGNGGLMCCMCFHNTQTHQLRSLFTFRV